MDEGGLSASVPDRMTQADGAETLRRLEALESVRLPSSGLPPLGVDIFPEPESGWMIFVMQHPDSGERSQWYITDLAAQMLEEPDVLVFDEGVQQIGWLQEGQVQQRKHSRWRTLATMTIFLPQALLLALLRFPTRPGSPYTLGQAVLGFTSMVAVIVAVAALFLQNWLALAVGVYWWVGSKVIEVEGRARGYNV